MKFRSTLIGSLQVYNKFHFILYNFDEKFFFNDLTIQWKGKSRYCMDDKTLLRTLEYFAPKFKPTDIISTLGRCSK